MPNDITSFVTFAQGPCLPALLLTAILGTMVTWLLRRSWIGDRTPQRDVAFRRLLWIFGGVSLAMFLWVFGVHRYAESRDNPQLWILAMLPVWGSAAVLIPVMRKGELIKNPSSADPLPPQRAASLTPRGEGHIGPRWVTAAAYACVGVAITLVAITALQREDDRGLFQMPGVWTVVGCLPMVVLAQWGGRMILREPTPRLPSQSPELTATQEQAKTRKAAAMATCFAASGGVMCLFGASLPFAEAMGWITREQAISVGSFGGAIIGSLAGAAGAAVGWYGSSLEQNWQDRFQRERRESAAGELA